MAYHHPFQVTGFHSCDRTTGLSILNGKDSLKASKNPWDWLGPGVYFWEQNLDRALEYAIECARGKQKFSGKITDPFVIGANIELGNCLNLLEPKSLAIVKQAYDGLEALMKISGQTMPKNNGANRELDCAVIQAVHESNRDEGLAPYDSIRSAFLEGKPIYPSSNFTHRLHIEICVINPDLVKGYFLPRPVEKFNPYLETVFPLT